MTGYTFHNICIGAADCNRVVSMRVPFSIDGIPATELSPGLWTLTCPTGKVIDFSYNKVNLTNRERDLCEYITNNPNLVYKLIAYNNRISIGTLKIHLWHIYAKFNVHSKKHMIEAYRKWR